jgi:L-fuconolactonase
MPLSRRSHGLPENDGNDSSDGGTDFFAPLSAKRGRTQKKQDTRPGGITMLARSFTTHPARELAMPNSTRRQFLQHSAALVACAAGALSAPAAADKGQPIIDTHQHLWDLKKFRLPWIKKGSPLAKNYLLAEYAEATKGLPIEQTVYMEVDVDPDQQPAEAEYVAALCQRADTHMAAAVVSGRPASDGFAKHLDRFRTSAFIKGIRQVLHGESTPAGTCLDPKYIKGIQLLGERGLSFDLCMRPNELTDAAKLAKACPGTRFILDHCGNGPLFEDRSKWEKGIAELAAQKNVVVVKISGIIAQTEGRKWAPEDLAPVINHTMKVFGPDRVMFAGDWPVCTLGATYRVWVETLREIVADRPAQEQSKLFHDNAVRIYGLAQEEL